MKYSEDYAYKHFINRMNATACQALAFVSYTLV